MLLPSDRLRLKVVQSVARVGVHEFRDGPLLQIPKRIHEPGRKAPRVHKIHRPGSAGLLQVDQTVQREFVARYTTFADAVVRLRSLAGGARGNSGRDKDDREEHMAASDSAADREDRYAQGFGFRADTSVAD